MSVEVGKKVLYKYRLFSPLSLVADERRLLLRFVVRGHVDGRRLWKVRCQICVKSIWSRPWGG